MLLRILFFVGLCLVGAVAVAEAPVQPQPRQHVQLSWPKFEPVSTSPTGMVRNNPVDERTFRFAPSGDKIIGMNAGGWRFEVWDLKSTKSLGTFGRAEMLTDFVVSPDGKHLVGIAAFGQVGVWDLSQRLLLRQLDEGVNFTEFRAVTFLDDQRCLFVGQEAQSLVVAVWSMESGDELERHELPLDRSAWTTGGQIFAAAVSPCQASVAVVEGNSVVLRERFGLGVQRLLGFLPTDRHNNPRVDMAEFSPDGHLLAVTSGAAVRLYDIIAGKELPPIECGERVRAIHFSADGATLTALNNCGELLTFAMRDLTKPLPEGEPTPAVDLAALLPIALNGTQREAFFAMRRLAENSAAAVAIIKEQLQLPAGVNVQQMEEIIKLLISDDPAERKQGARKLEGRYQALETAIQNWERNRASQNADPQAEQRARHRLAQLRARFSGARIDEIEFLPQRPRKLVELLSALQSTTAQQYLEELSQGRNQSGVTDTATRILRWSSFDADEPTTDQILALLQGDDSLRAFEAIRFAAQDWPKQRDMLGVELSKLAAQKNLGDSPHQARQLIADLGAVDLDKREAAALQLQELGSAVQPLLQAKLATKIDAVTRMRIEEILETMEPAEKLATSRFAARIVAVVFLAEGVDSPLLATAAKESQNAWLREHLKSIRGRAKAIPSPQTE